MVNMNRRLQLSEVKIQESGGGTSRQNSSLSVSWNVSGTILASASQSGTKLWPIDVNSSATHTLREMATLSHSTSKPIDRVRFHPTEESLLCTSSEDQSVQLWDVRDRSGSSGGSSALSRSFGKIKLKSKKSLVAASVEWHPQHSSYLALTEKDNSVHIYDVRKLNAPSAGDAIKSFKFDDVVISETHFSPSGSHLVSAARRVNDGMGIIQICPWGVGGEVEESGMNDEHESLEPKNKVSTFVGHTGPIYSISFSPDGKFLATGGNDALVGLWDVKSMTCQATISSRTKFIRSVAFSHDSKVVACCSEEEGVDLAEPKSGNTIGSISLIKGSDRERGGSSRFGGSSLGSDEIVFHPKVHVLACARGQGVPQISIARLHYN
jgi:WD40 repeat protein